MLVSLSEIHRMPEEGGEPDPRITYELRVKDNGIGMTKEFAETVFEAFARERTSTVSGIQGTGLGMAITKNIVDVMGGTIELKTAQGEGTEYIIRLPVYPAEGPVEHAKEAFAVEKMMETLNQVIISSGYDRK